MIKKIIYIIAIIAILMISSTVYAETVILRGSEFLYNITYDKFDGTYHNRSYVRIIRDDETGNVVYCIEPFKGLIDGKEYKVYSDLRDFYEISDEDFERINLYAYYGYGYENHTDLKWVNITQMLIWRSLYGEENFNWIKSITSSANVVYPYETEIQELKSLVNSYMEKPKITKNINMELNDEITLQDDILSKYSLLDSGGLIVSLNSNQITIKANKEGTYKITLKKELENIGDDIKYFYAEGSQAAFQRGTPKASLFDIEVNIKKGSVKIIKVDSDTRSIIPSGSAKLEGAVFTLYDENMNEINDIIIDKNSEGFIDNLPFGKYSIVEKSAGKGYLKNNLKTEFEISFENPDIILKIGNSVIKSELKILKRYGTKEEFKNMTMKNEANVSFEIYSEEKLIDTITTDENGEASINLPYGTYEVKQINSKENYAFVDSKKIIIDENSSSVIELVLDDYEIEVPNARVDYKNFRMLCLGVINEYFIN